MKIQMTKAEIVTKLKDNIVAAKAEDAIAAKAHHKDEANFLDTFRSRCREASKWDYVTAKQNGFAIRMGYNAGPSCPKLQATPLQRILDQITLDKREQLAFAHDSDIGKAVLWKPAAERVKESACD